MAYIEARTNLGIVGYANTEFMAKSAKDEATEHMERKGDEGSSRGSCSTHPKDVSEFGHQNIATQKVIKGVSTTIPGEIRLDIEGKRLIVAHARRVHTAEDSR